MSNVPGGASVDVITANGLNVAGSGAVAQRLLKSNFNVESLRTQDVLQNREWIQFDNKVVEVARKRLIAVGDLVSAGLTYDVPNALGVTKLEWERSTDLTDAIVSMSGITAGQADRIEFDLQSIPLPIVHKDFHINIRALESSRRQGLPLDTMQAELAARIVSERIETMLFNGSNVAGTSNKIFGYTTQTNRNTGSVTASWLTATGEQILTDALAMVDKLVADNMYGPYVLYVPNAVYVKLGADFKANSDKSVLTRLKEIPGLINIRPAPDLTGTVVVMVQLSSDVVDMIDGIQPTLVQWESQGGMMINFKVIAIMVPRVKADKASQSGIAHYS